LKSTMSSMSQYCHRYAFKT
jgi:hypothetical protein